jgi:hypothetical protein
VRLDPQFRYHWPDGSSLTVPDGDDDTPPPSTRSHLARATVASASTPRRRIWDVSRADVLRRADGESAGARQTPDALAVRPAAIDPLRTLHRAAAAFFDDPAPAAVGRSLCHLLRVVAVRRSRHAGLHPAHRGPVRLLVPDGRPRRDARAFERVAARSASRSAPAPTWPGWSPTPTGRVGVWNWPTEDRRADIVVANVDAEHLYGDLLPDGDALRRVRRAKRSTSGFVLCAGVRGLTPRHRHHNVWFSESYRAEYDQLDAGRLADDPTIYACVSSVTDPSQAPDGCENWFLLVNTPPDVEVDRRRVRRTRARPAGRPGDRPAATRRVPTTR